MKYSINNLGDPLADLKPRVLANLSSPSRLLCLAVEAALREDYWGYVTT